MPDPTWRRTPEEEAGLDDLLMRDLTRWAWIAAAVLVWIAVEYLLKIS